MRRNPLAARRYAKSLFDVYREKNETAQVLDELRALLNIFKKLPEAWALVISPVVSKIEKMGVLSEPLSIFQRTSRFIELLIDSGRIEALHEIVEEFEQLVRSESGALTVELSMAHQLSAGLIEDVRLLLEDLWKKKILLQTKLEPALLGGFVARSSGRMLDASLSAQLDRVRETVAN